MHVSRYTQTQTKEYHRLFDSVNADVIVDIAAYGVQTDPEKYFARKLKHKQLNALADEMKPYEDDANPKATVAIVCSEFDGKGAPPRSYCVLGDIGKFINVLHLTGLQLDHARFWNNFPRWFPKLAHLIITDIDTEPRNLVALSKCPRLTRVGIHRSNPTPSHVAALAREGSSIETVCLLGNEDFSADDVAEVEKMGSDVHCIVDDFDDFDSNASAAKVTPTSSEPEKAPAGTAIDEHTVSGSLCAR